MTRPIRVMLAEPSRIVREAVASALEGDAAFEVVGETQGGEGTARLVEALTPAVMVLGLSVPQHDAVDTVRRLSTACPDVAVLVLSSVCTRDLVEALFDAGARGLLSTRSSLDGLLDALLEVAAGREYLDPSIGEDKGTERSGWIQTTWVSNRTDLTAREREVVKLLAEGCSTSDVARTLEISTKTVDAHRQNIYLKLGVSSLAEVTKYALREGLTTLEI